MAAVVERAYTPVMEPQVLHREAYVPLAYDQQLDAQAFQSLYLLKNNPGRYEREKAMLVPYIFRQIETHIGERLNVGISRTRYNIREGTIYGENMQRPFLDVIKEGRDKRRAAGSPDGAREDAEVIGFAKIQDVLCNEETPLGTMMLSISPSSGSYKHNFYDIFTLKEDEQGKYVEARRYTSGLEKEEYLNKLNLLTGENVFINEPLDVYFLKNPKQLAGWSPEKLHAYLHQDHRFLPEEEFQKKVLRDEDFQKICQTYIHGLLENPFNTKDSEYTFNGIQIAGDDAAGITKRVKRQDVVVFQARAQDRMRVDEGAFFSMQQVKEYIHGRDVRVVMTGCGSSGSVTVPSIFGGSSSESQGWSLANMREKAGTASAPWSVSDFAHKGELKDDLGDRMFKCPACNVTNIRPYNQKVPKCQNDACPDPTAVAC